ncbi:MAG: hypothetical protein MEQ07_10250 [Aquimonas sp.]|nr:hypothetical protein [Aquimonas sp.]
MYAHPILRFALAFLAAVVLTVAWGSLVQTQYNLAALIGIGVEIGPAVNLQASLTDVFSGFSPTYAGYIVLPALMVAFFLAWQVVKRAGAPLLWFPLAGGLAILAGIPLVNWLSPLALLIGASRDFSSVVVMALGGAASGAMFGWLAFPDLPAFSGPPIS